MSAAEIARGHGLAASYGRPPFQVWSNCGHSHSLTGTAVFYQSLGVLQCNKCSGYQAIKKPLK